MKKIILSLLIIFISLPAPAASAPRTADLEITVLYREDQQPSAAAFIKIGNSDFAWQVDTNGKLTISNVSTGQEYTISEVGSKNITYIVTEDDMQKQSDGSYLIKKTFYLEPDENNTITESTIGSCTKEELTKVNAKKGHFINNQCQPTECIEPRYELSVVSGSLEKNPELYRAECVDLDGTDCFDIDDIYALTGVYKYDENSNELNCVSESCIKGYTLNTETKKCMVNECPCGQEKSDNMCIYWEVLGTTECKEMPKNAATAERACNKRDQEYCKILTCKGDEYKSENLHEFRLDTDENECVSRVGEKCTPPTTIAHAKSYKYYQDPDNNSKVFCGVNRCKNYATKSVDNKTCTVDPCTKAEETNLKRQGATQTAKIVTARGKAVCIPTECKSPQYQLHEDDDAPENNKCVNLVGQDCDNITVGYESHADTTAGGVYGYDSSKDELFCYPVKCTQNYTLDRNTKKCVVNECPCGQEKSDNMCIDWVDTYCEEKNAATAERDCKGGEEYCKILTCNGDEYKSANLHEFELDPDRNKCISRENGKCNPTGIEHATDGKYKKSDTQYKLFCAVTKCGANYVPNDEGTQCIPSDCTKEQEDILKAAHAASWKLADNKKDCIPTKCQCGYGNKDGEPVNGTCVTSKWSWNNDTPPEEDTKIPCTEDNASEAYMDCREDGKAYCRVYKCENEFTLYGNECIQDTCDLANFPNARYVKRVGDRCVIQKCKTGYDVDTERNKCVARDGLLSEEDSEARIKKLQENEDAVAENAQRIENKLMDTLGIGGAGMGGQMMASGIAQKTADEAAERDMTAYLATFRCKYGNESVDSGGDEVQLPGANDAKYGALLSEYKTLAASLKLSKAALGMAPGIESDEILDGSTLYGRGNTGGADGAYLSLADALSGDKDAQEEWDDQKDKARDMAIGGGVLAGASIIGSAVGSYFENKDAPKNKADAINQEYDAKRGPITPKENTEDPAANQ